MAANTSPIFTIAPNVDWTGNLTSGTNTYDGTSGTTLLFTAGENGAFVQSMVAQSAGTNVATVLRIFINNGLDTSTASNNSLIAQFSLPTTVASASSAINQVEFKLEKVLPAGYKLYAVLGTTVAAGWTITAFGGDY